MNKIKKIVFWISLGGLIFHLAFIFVARSLDDLCRKEGDCFSFWESLSSTIGPALVFFPLLALFSSATYFLREEVFRSWFNFAKWWVPISIFLILIVPEANGGSFFISIDPKFFIASTTFILFFIISFIIIIKKFFDLRR